MGLANLSDAKLGFAMLGGANLGFAKLGGADLSTASNLTQAQLNNQACGTAATKLAQRLTLKPCPEDLRPPARP